MTRTLALVAATALAGAMMALTSGAGALGAYAPLLNPTNNISPVPNFHSGNEATGPG
jgi:hypothetical protein